MYDDNLYLAWADGEEGNWNIHVSDLNQSNTPSRSKPIDSSLLIIIIIIISLLISLSIIYSTEFGRYTFIKLFGSPFYSRIHREEVLKHNIRQQLLAHLNMYPGNNFRSIQKTMSISSGTLAYHLSVLEREEYILSKQMGSYHRFYPRNYNSPTYPPNNEDLQPNVIKEDIQERILQVVQSHPGISQKELGELVGLSNTGINYHVNIMANARVIRVDRDGKWTRCYISDENY